MLVALRRMGDVPTRSLHAGDYVEWYACMVILNEVERTLASLLQP
jgi:hypothetical protein